MNGRNLDLYVSVQKKPKKRTERSACACISMFTLGCGVTLELPCESTSAALSTTSPRRSAPTLNAHTSSRLNMKSPHGNMPSLRAGCYTTAEKKTGLWSETYLGKTLQPPRPPPSPRAQHISRGINVQIVNLLMQQIINQQFITKLAFWNW